MTSIIYLEKRGLPLSIYIFLIHCNLMDLLYIDAHNLCVFIRISRFFQIFSRIIHLVFSIFMIINQAFKTHGKSRPVPHPGMGRKSVLHHKNGR